MEIKCRVINLDSREDRLDFVSVEMKKINMKWERFSAVDANEKISKCQAHSLSHVKAITNEKGLLLVCEDDVIFIDDALEIFNLSMSQLPSYWDILYLGANVKGRGIRYSENLFRIPRSAHCTHAVLYNEQSRDVILKNFDPMTNKYGIYDNWLFYEGQKIMNCFICYPMIAYQRPCYSDMLSCVVDYNKDMEINAQKNLI